MVFNTKLVLFFIKSFLLIILFSTKIICLDEEEQRKIFVLEVFSNGITSSKTNKNNQDVLGETWLNSEELTNMGIRQQYLLGINDKALYKNFIDDTFNLKDILIKSLNISYNIQSAYSHLHGIYKPQNGQKLQNEFDTRFFLNFNNLNEIEQEKINDINNNSNYSAVLSGVNIVPVHIFDFDINNNEKCPNYFQLKKNNI